MESTACCPSPVNAAVKRQARVLRAGPLVGVFNTRTSGRLVYVSDLFHGLVISKLLWNERFGTFRSISIP